MLCGSLYGRGVWGRKDMCICMAESLCCSPETITTLLIGYTPVQNKKCKLKKKKGGRVLSRSPRWSLQPEFDFKCWAHISMLSFLLKQEEEVGRASAALGCVLGVQRWDKRLTVWEQDQASRPRVSLQKPPARSFRVSLCILGTHILISDENFSWG